MKENLSLYHIFYTVGKTGNISLAAKELYISQPAVSRAVQKLETNLDTRLFKRSSRGVFLTADGKLLFDKIKAAFELVAEGENSIIHKNASPETGYQHHTLPLCTSVPFKALHLCKSAGTDQYFLPGYLPDSPAS